MEDNFSPDEIRTIRERLGLSQTEAGELIGGGARAFTKYESGKVKPAAAVANLLRLLDENPQLLETLTGKPLTPKPMAARSPFEVSGKHIEALGAEDLKELAKRLIYGEAFAHSISADGIHVADNITAPDDGEDARIEWDGAPSKTKFFRSNLSQFQLKAGKMDTKRAGAEVIRKDGTIKAAVVEVLSKGGTYTMLCASSYTYKEIQIRRKAISDALTKAGMSLKKGQIAFFDSSMIAGWVNTLPAVAVWVLERTERSSIGGFRSWEYWAGSADHLLPYFEDNRLTPIKDLLLESARTVRSIRRMVGASGVGKSRLVLEAFRPVEGEEWSQDRLDKALVYVDEQNAGTNAVKLALQNMADSGVRSIVVVDRCPMQTHRELSSLVRRTDSQLSLITIDDEIPGVLDSDTTLLKKSEKSVTDGILMSLAENLPRDDFSRIAKFAEGFPKIATLLAEYLTNGPMTADIPADLAQAIVTGRESHDPDLIIRGTQVLGLFGFVYERELDAVASFGRQLDGTSLRAVIRRLEERGLVQAKGDGIIIQPKPVALALARSALIELGKSRWDEIVTAEIHDGLRERATDQIALLNTTAIGLEVGRHLLRWDGPLGTMDKLYNGMNHRYFMNLTVVDLEAALSILQHELQNLSDDQIRDMPGPVRRSLVHALEKICFKAETFERGALLMLRLAVNENESWGNNATGQFVALFPIELADTEAGMAARLSVLEHALDTTDERQQLIAVKALLEATGLNSFSRSIGPEIHGSKPALKSWRPETWKELWEYVELACDMLIELALLDNEVGEIAKRGLGHHIRSLVVRGRLEIVERAITSLTSSGIINWPEASESLGHVLEYDAEGLSPEIVAKTHEFIDLLSPKRLEDRLNYLVLNMPWDYPCGEGLEFEQQRQRQTDDVHAFAKELLATPTELERVLPLVVEIAPTKEGRGHQRRVFSLGEGIAKFSTDPMEWLPIIVGAIKVIAPDARDYSILSGFLCELHKSNPEFVDGFKEEIAASDTLAVCLPSLCAAIGVKDSDAPLCLELLKEGKVNPWHIAAWQYGLAMENVTPSAAANIFNTLLSIGADGYVVALNLMGMYCHSRMDMLNQFLPELKLIAKNAAVKTNRGSNSTMDEHHFKQLMNRVLSRGRGDQAAREIATSLVKHLVESEGSVASDMVKPLIPQLLSDFPEISWAIIGQAIVSDKVISWRLEHLLGDMFSFGENQTPAILSFPEEMLFAWCHANPERAPAFLGAILPVLTSRRPDDLIRDIHPAMRRLLDEFGDNEKLLDAITRNIGTYGWSGSRAKYYELYEVPLKSLENHPKRKVRFWAIEMLKNLGLQKASAKREEGNFEGENDL